ncbi:ISAs1 family transposase [Rubrivirga sp. S365]|nr:ISAs1 family transposase [Rubrivirga sp. S365]MDT7857225.1 ISAs1 family transposase [Rubrivirga sp. S365]
MTLLDHLATVPDPRRPQGLRHPLHAILAGAVMATMSGHHGYRPISRFLRDNADALREHLGFARHALPSHVTVRAVLQAVDPAALSAAFRAWATARLPDGEVLAVDAKAVRSTVSGHDADGRPTTEQDFVALVSAYGVRSGIVASATAYRNGDTSEVAAAQDLVADLAAALDLRGTTVTLDALHCTKKRSAASGTPAASGSSS